MATGFNISSFKNRGLALGGARPALFEVYMSQPAGLRGINQRSLDKFRFTCRAAAIPASTVSSVDIGYFGRKIKVSGDRTFTDWTVTVMNDEDFAVRSFFEKWSNSLNSLQSNIRDASYVGSESLYKSELNVIQYGKAGDVIRAYDIIGAFPTSVDAITLDWDTTNQIETFNVTFAYDYWLPDAATDTVNSYRTNATTPISF